MDLVAIFVIPKYRDCDHDVFFNAAQPGVGRVQVLGSKKIQLQEKVFVSQSHAKTKVYK